MARKPTGRVTPRKGAPAPARPASRELVGKATSTEKWDVQDSRSVRTPWVWRVFLLLSLFGIGVAIILDGNHHRTFAVLWLVISAGWFAVAMWLWRQHSRYMRR
ncbi:MAG TPA: hypothetical protein VKI19_16095 [Acidimicrobiales bacterium]|nr:hypothetical protein [Acidimicrobiales bacterium]